MRECDIKIDELATRPSTGNESIWELGNRIHIVTDRWSNLSWTEKGRVYEIVQEMGVDHRVIRKVALNEDRTQKPQTDKRTTPVGPGPPHRTRNHTCYTGQGGEHALAPRVDNYSLAT